jgi:hypothetical protein
MRRRRKESQPQRAAAHCPGHRADPNAGTHPDASTSGYPDPASGYPAAGNATSVPERNLRRSERPRARELRSAYGALQQQRMELLAESIRHVLANGGVRCWVCPGPLC